MKTHFIILGALLLANFSYAQEGGVGINTETPMATFDVMASPGDLSKTDGIIAPRLKGSELKAKDTNYTINQTGAIVYVTEALESSNTTTKTTNVTAVGYFYFDGNVWQKMLGNGSPWNVENTTTQASLNNQNIYQNGKIGIGNFSSTKPIANLDVRGSVRGGMPHNDELDGTSLIGLNSIALGHGNKASGEAALALGAYGSATGDYSIALGSYAEASGTNSTAIGYYAISSGWNAMSLCTAFCQATGANSLAMGDSTIASGNFSTVMGFDNVAPTPFETVIGTGNAIRTGSPIDSGRTTALFQIGNGTITTSYNNAMTVLKNGHTAIGVNGVEDAAKPTELLDLGGSDTDGNGGVRIRNINSPAYTGTSTDKIVVANAMGVLKTIPVTTLNAASFDFSSLPTYENDATAGTAGLVSGKLYKTSTGEIRIKL